MLPRSPQVADLETLIHVSGSRRSADRGCLHAHEINRLYDGLANHVSAEELVEMRLARSLWARRTMHHLVGEAGQQVRSSADWEVLLAEMASVRSLIPSSRVRHLLELQTRWGTPGTAEQLSLLLAEFSDADVAREAIEKLGASPRALLRLGPKPIGKFRPMRKSGHFNPSKWLDDPAMSRLEFVDGNPDHIRVRGIELRSGDIGVVDLNHPCDGLLDSFLDRPSVASHLVLYVTLRHRSKTGDPLHQPAIVEIYEGGWRRVPITTLLSPRYSWYSQWVRVPGLPDNVGERLSEQIERMEIISFDFQGRRIPQGGVFPIAPDQPCATCTNLVRVPFERIGVELPYPTTRIAPGAQKNLERLGLFGIHEGYTPTNVLNDSGFAPVGIVDNGVPEWSIAQAIVVGRPEMADTFGGNMSHRPLILANLPNWTSVQHWRSAMEAAWVALGQSDHPLAGMLRKACGVEDKEVPRSASETAIAFYMRSDFIAGDIAKLVYPMILSRLEDDAPFSFEALKNDAEIRQIVKTGIERSAIGVEQWYGS